MIAEADREHDFGSVIAGPGRKIEHRYRLRNATPQDVKLLSVINRKTCCGIVRVEKTTLHPGDTTDVEVTLLVGGRFGKVTHATEIETDFPGNSNLVLLTTARAIAPIRVEEESAPERTVLVGAKAPAHSSFRVYASGAAAEPPADLDHIELRSTIRVDWVGSKESSACDGNLRVESRKFVVTLDPSGPPGERRAEVLLQAGQNVFHRHIVSWEIAPRITASPKVIAMRPGQRDYRVAIQSRDHTRFRIRRIECEVAGIQCRALTTTPEVAQIVQVEAASQSKARRGAVRVFTDHPIQEKVDLPFILIE